MNKLERFRQWMELNGYYIACYGQGVDAKQIIKDFERFDRGLWFKMMFEPISPYALNRLKRKITRKLICLIGKHRWGVTTSRARRCWNCDRTEVFNNNLNRWQLVPFVVYSDQTIADAYGQCPYCKIALVELTPAPNVGGHMVCTKCGYD